jgi:hypothetical protein
VGDRRQCVPPSPRRRVLVSEPTAYVCREDVTTPGLAGFRAARRGAAAKLRERAPLPPDAPLLFSVARRREGALFVSAWYYPRSPDHD